MAYAILRHGIDPKERVFCPGGLTFYGRPFRCHGKHGSVDLATALQVSCDSYFYTMGKRLGIDAIAETGKRFGFGRRDAESTSRTRRPASCRRRSGASPCASTPGTRARRSPSRSGRGPSSSRRSSSRARCRGIANADGALPTPHLFHIGENVRTGERFVYRPAVEGVRLVDGPPARRSSSTASGAS